MADDVVQIQSTGSPAQNIDNASVQRPDGTVVDRQRVTLKNDTSFDQAPMLEQYLQMVLEVLNDIRMTLKMHSYLLAEILSDQPDTEIDLDELEEGFERNTEL